MKEKLISFWEKITYQGINSDTDLHLLRRVILFNRFGFSFGFFSILVGIFWFTQQHFTFLTLFTQISISISFFAILFLNKKKLYLFSQLQAIFVINIGFLILSSTWGRESGEFLFYIPILSCSLLIFDIKLNFLSLLALLLPIFCLLTLEIFNYSLISHPDLSKNMFLYNLIFCIITCFLTTYQIIAIFKEQQEKFVEAEAKNIQLEMINAKILRLGDLQQNKLLKIEKELSGLNSLKDKVFSIVAHDLRSPISALQGFLSLISIKELNQERIKQYTTQISEKLNNVNSLLENLLNWSLSQLNHLDMKVEEFAVFSLVSDTLKLYDFVANQKNIELLNRVKPDMKAVGDVNMILLVLRNLVNNAIKFTHPEGRVIINCRLRGENVEIIVSDTGIGMNAEKVSLLFNPETHFSMRGTNNEKGSGLGLILCKEFVEKNNGQLSVESQEGRGTHFIVILPAKISN